MPHAGARGSHRRPRGGVKPSPLQNTNKNLTSATYGYSMRADSKRTLPTFASGSMLYSTQYYSRQPLQQILGNDSKVIYRTCKTEAPKPSGTTTEMNEGVSFRSAVIGQYGGYSSSTPPPKYTRAYQSCFWRKACLEPFSLKKCACAICRRTQ